MKKIAAVYLPIAILAAALVLGGLKLASEVFAQSEEPSYEDGWLVSSFTSIAFEDGLWEQAVVVGGCTSYSSLPKEDNPASVMASNGPRSLAGKPLAGFCATRSRRIQDLYAMVVHVIRCNTHYAIDNRR